MYGGVPQRFLFRTPGLPNVDRASLKTAILHTIESESAYRLHRLSRHDFRPL